ncbi:hypothetical protein Poli38472_001554 [Pythium oligandrum]|uniref:Uncharacterized protein n=1 Tax=Pythium oligandrum TaxID=41045 RepID=A0A8K1CW91_PYTOL|nr:hypothetical protein Poli38472_001554 [Pythium oligandrum]|eukprot:TMW69398.1 hypothetical protein Poli38472_001554 [Pythium oligandrum]
MASGECFHVRRLLWEELTPLIRPSEAEELRRAIGTRLIEDNAVLQQELSALVEMLSEFQQQTDSVRDALLKRRPRLPEPPGRALLLDKLKLLANDLRESQVESLPSTKEQELLQYVLTTDALQSHVLEPPSTPRIADLAITPRDGIVLRPGTSSGRRPGTASSSRPVSRGSTVSAASTASTILESPEVRQRLNVEEIDSIREDVRDALEEEQQQLMEDIEFIQGCIDMEQDLLEEDRRQVLAMRPPPTLQELHDFRKTLEQTLEQQEAVARVEAMPSFGTRRPSLEPVPPLQVRPSARSRSISIKNYLSVEEDDEDDEWRRERSGRARLSASSSTKVLKIRHVIQEARDEPFLS